jgi:transcriptional regulator with XRE-family HTH domain
MTNKDTVFFKELGTRIKVYRKELGLTQIQLAKVLNISQQHMGSFENGIRKIPASMLPTLAELFGISLETLYGQEVKNGQTKRGPTPKLLKQVEQLASLPKNKQKFVMEMLDTVIKQQASL